MYTTAMDMTTKTSTIMDQPQVTDIIPTPSPWCNNGWTDVKLLQVPAPK